MKRMQKKDVEEVSAEQETENKGITGYLVRIHPILNYFKLHVIKTWQYICVYCNFWGFYFFIFYFFRFIYLFMRERERERERGRDTGRGRSRLLAGSQT